jgi:hypothetical protein
MLTLVGNLILASLALLVCFMGEAGCHSALSSLPPHPHGPITIREVVQDALVICWFAGAVGLFYRKRIAWWLGSLIGIGATACFFGALLGAAVWSCFFPDASMERLKDHGSVVYAMALVFLFGQFSLLVAVSLGLFVGLFRMRRDLR